MPPSHVLKIHFNIILPSTPGSSKWAPSLRSPCQNLVYIFLLPHTCYMPTHLLFYLNNHIIFSGEYRSFISSLCSFPHSPVTSSLLGQNIRLITLFSNTLSLLSSPSVRDQIPHLYKTTSKIIVLYNYYYYCYYHRCYYHLLLRLEWILVGGRSLLHLFNGQWKMAVLYRFDLVGAFSQVIKDGSTLFLLCPSYLEAQMDPTSAVCTRHRQAGKQVRQLLLVVTARWLCPVIWCCCSVCLCDLCVTHQTYRHVKWVTYGRDVLWHKLAWEMAICYSLGINNNTGNEHRRSWLSVCDAVKVAKCACCDDA